jgi:hypothetical protein
MKNIKITAITTIVVILLFISVSLLLGIKFHWYVGLIPAVLIYLIEYGCRIAKFKDFYPPLSKSTYLWFAAKFKHSKEEISSVTDYMPKSSLLSDISQWLVKDMVQCICYNNLSSIGQGTQEELQAALNKLLSDYQKARNNQDVKARVRVMADILLIETQWQYVNTLGDMMHKFYSEEGAEVLRKLYPKWQYGCDFTPESFASDWKKICQGELRNKLLHEQLTAKLKDLESKINSKENSPSDIHKNILRKIADIRKVEAVNLDVMNMSVMELAIYENRLDEHIEYLQEQISKNGRPAD